MKALVKLILLGICLSALNLGQSDAARSGIAKRLTTSNARVVIVGGGVADLSAARRLKERNFKNVIILEGSDRLGGLVNTIPYST
jgi:NADPH-dependent 2,4-dienoyl-CoA reductase/sulfur reductase-like enzyme